MSQFRQFLSDSANGRLSLRGKLLAGLAWLPLRLFSGVYWLAAQQKNWLFDLGLRKPAPSGVPVISVGNLSVGGTGKSPMVRWLVGCLQDEMADSELAILSRGYKQLDEEANDEVLEFKEYLPGISHFLNPDRIASARTAVDEHRAKLLILDDGFQHRRLGRDLDLVMVDASESTKLHRVLPAGVFREPFGNIARAQAIVLTHCDRVSPSQRKSLAETIQQHNQQAILCETAHAPTRLLSRDRQYTELASLKDRNVLAFCGLGRPDSFFGSLKNAGISLKYKRAWPDHHHFTAEDVCQLKELAAKHECDALVCTMKDWVKLRDLALPHLPIFALQIELKFLSGEDELRQLVLQTARADS